MLRRQLRGVGVVLQHAGEGQLGPAQAEIHRRLGRVLDKLRQVVPRAQPGQDAVALPSPGDDLFAGEIAEKMPVVLLRELLNSPVEAVVVPSERHEHPFLAFASHAA